MFLVNYFAVLSKKTYKGTTKNAHTQAKWEIICKKNESLIGAVFYALLSIYTFPCVGGMILKGLRLTIKKSSASLPSYYV